MTEESIISTKIDLLKERKELIAREIDFKIAMLEVKLRKPLPTCQVGKPINCCNASHTGDTTGTESPFKMPRQKPRAKNFDYKNEVETGEIAPETV